MHWLRLPPPFPLRAYFMALYLKGHGVKEESHEPVESDGGDLYVEVLQVVVQLRQLLHHDVLEHLLVCLRPRQVLVKVVRAKVFFCYSYQSPGI